MTIRKLYIYIYIYIYIYSVHEYCQTRYPVIELDYNKPIQKTLFPAVQILNEILILYFYMNISSQVTNMQDLCTEHAQKLQLEFITFTD